MTAIDTVQLADESMTTPVTVEKATQEIAEQASDPSAGPEALELTLEQVRQAVLANNLDLKVDLIDPTIAGHGLDAERAKFEAVFFGAGDYYHYSDDANATAETHGYEVGISKPLATGGSLQVGVPFGDNVSAGGVAEAAASVSYVQSLLQGAGTRVNTLSIRIAEHQWNITSAQTKLSAINLLARADSLYWGLYAARKTLDVRREQFDLATNQVGHAKKKVAAGASPKNEIVLAEAGLASRLEDVINAEASVQSYQRSLLRIMNRKDIPFEAVADIIPITEPSPLGLDLDEKRLAEKALEMRMEIVVAKQALDIDELHIESARDATRPDVTLSYTYRTRAEAGGMGGAFENLADDAYDTHSVGLSATIPLGNRAAKAHLQQARLARIQDEISLEELRRSIRLEVYEAVSELERNWRRIVAAKQGVIAAFRDYDVTQSQFQRGRRTSTDVLYSATQLASAQLTQIRAFAAYEVAQVDLAKATGTLLGHDRIFLEPPDLDDSMVASTPD